MKQQKIIAICPIKNEEWILKPFINATLLWADHIIFADQKSTDRTLDICSEYEAVTVIQNDSPVLDELYRQQILIAEARRKFPNIRKIIVSLDADEFFTSNILDNKDWKNFLENAPEGSVLTCPRVNIGSNLEYYWDGGKLDVAYVDDGRPHNGYKIHSHRIPIYADAKRFYIEEVKTLHLQYIDWERMLSKHRWYLVLELIDNMSVNFIKNERMYSHMHYVPFWKKRKIPYSWTNNYVNKKINIYGFTKPDIYSWDLRLKKYIEENGSSKIAHLNIWTGPFAVQHTHNVRLKFIYRWIQLTNFLYHNFRVVRFMLNRIDKALYNILKGSLS